jgi:hypothetical protein
VAHKGRRFRENRSDIFDQDLIRGVGRCHAPMSPRIGDVSASGREESRRAVTSHPLRRVPNPKETAVRQRNLTRAAAGLVAAAGLLAAPGAAEAAPDSRTTFVVNTQFWDEPSPIVSATGPLASCTSVQDEPGLATQTGPRTVLFSGVKTLNCAGGTVTITFEATLNFAAGRKTFGTWSVVDSTLPGVSFGGGRLTGDSTRCELLPGSEGCILDTFSGFVGS